MPKNEQVNIDITAKDNASKVIEGVAADVEELEHATPVIHVEADASAAVAGLDKATDAVDDLNRKAPTSVNSLRDVAGGLSGVNTQGLDAAESLLGLSETLTTLDPKFAKLGQSLATVGFEAGVIFVGLTLLEKGYDTLVDTLVDVEGAQTELNAALASGDIERVTKAVHDYVDEVEKAGKSELFKNIVGGVPGFLKIIQGGTSGIRAAFFDADARAKAFFDTLEKQGPAAAQALLDAFNKGPFSAEENTKFAAAIRERMEAQAIAAKAAKDVARDQDVLNRAVEEGIEITGRSIDAIRREVQALDALDEADKAAAERNSRLADERIEDAKDLAAARKDLADAQEALNDAEAAVVEERRAELTKADADATRDLEKATGDLAKADREEASAAQGVSQARERQLQASEGLVDAQERLSDATAKQADATKALETAQANVTRLLEGYGRAATESADALERMDDAQRGLERSTLGLTDAQQAYNDAQKDLARLQRFYGDTQSPAARRRLQDAERQVARTRLGVADATDALEGAQSDLNTATEEYDGFVSGFPADSAKVRQAMEDQERASRNLEQAQRGTRDAVDGVNDANKNLVDANRNVENALRTQQTATQNVATAQQTLRTATDDSRRAQFELADYTANHALPAISAAQQNVIDKQHAYEAAIRATEAAQTSLNTAVSRAPVPASGFMNGAPPAGSNFSSRVDVNVNLNNGIVTDSYLLGKTIAENLSRYLQATGQLPPNGSVWR